MSSPATPLFFKPPSMANICVTKHTTLLFIPKHSSSVPSLPSKPIKLHLSSFPSLVSIRKKTHSLVSQTSDWARQDEEESLVEDCEEFNWETQEGKKTEAHLSEWEGEEGSGSGEGEEGGQYGSVEPPEEAKLFVGNLPYDVDSENLAQLFYQAGVVEVAEVIYNRQTDQSRGFGFVTMSTVEEAEKAVEMLHRYDINGRLLTVNKAAPRGSNPELPPRMVEPSFRMYIGNLPWQVNNDRLKQVCSEHGNVVSARVVYDQESGRSRGFGFVAMSTQTELNDAIAALNGQNLDGRELKVSVAEERPRRSF